MSTQMIIISEIISEFFYSRSHLGKSIKECSMHVERPQVSITEWGLALLAAFKGVKLKYLG